MNADFLGRGWRFPLLPDASGALAYSDGPQHIEHSLKHILMTTFGERVMRPDFGCEAPDLVFAPGRVQYRGCSRPRCATRCATGSRAWSSSS